MLPKLDRKIASQLYLVSNHTIRLSIIWCYALSCTWGKVRK